MNNNLAILPSCYLPPIQYYSKLINYSAVLVEYYEHFKKQTYRNRCYIYGANGKLFLTIPVLHQGEKTLTKDIRISYETDWQKRHWRSIESAYRSSPYFEFYEDDFIQLYIGNKFEFLVDFNEALIKKINQLLGIEIEMKKTQTYQKEYEEMVDFRDVISPKKNYNQDIEFSVKEYSQVFNNKHGFLSNLSIIDLLFNEGKSSKDFI